MREGHVAGDPIDPGGRRDLRVALAKSAVNPQEDIVNGVIDRRFGNTAGANDPPDAIGELAVQPLELARFVVEFEIATHVGCIAPQLRESVTAVESEARKTRENPLGPP